MKNLKFMLLSLALGFYGLASAFSLTNNEMPKPILNADKVIILNADEELRNEIINFMGNHDFDHFTDVKTRVLFKLNENGTIKVLKISLNHYNSDNIKAFIKESLHNKIISIYAPQKAGTYIVPITIKRTD